MENFIVRLVLRQWLASLLGVGVEDRLWSLRRIRKVIGDIVLGGKLDFETLDAFAE